MLSRAEREFLGAMLAAPVTGKLPRGHAPGPSPSPAYRRKLLWSIRRKLDRAARDWQLVRRAAEVESRVLPPARGPVPRLGALPMTGTSVRVPVAEDPLLRWLRAVGGPVRSGRAATAPARGAVVRPPRPSRGDR